jgi:predicted Ser/Thr protein kinase
MTEAFFEHSGHVREMGWIFTTYKSGGCKEIKKNYVFQFSNVQPGEEYILTVSNVCNDKYVTNEQTGSIQIN